MPATQPRFTPTTEDYVVMCRRLTERLSEITGIAFTFGYIGNVTPTHDDRAWYAFAPHPGRVGTREDSIGGLTTDELNLMTVLLRGAIALARVQNTPR